MLSFAKTLLLKLESVATSMTYVNGRTADVDALLTINVIGCLSTATLVPEAGSAGCGAVILTPGMGPATVGLSGFELFDDWQATSATSAVTTTAADATLRDIDLS